MLSELHWVRTSVGKGVTYGRAWPKGEGQRHVDGVRRLLLAVGLLLMGTTVRADDTDDFVEAQMRWRHIPGLSLAAVHEGHLVRAQGYGTANLETGTLAGAETSYRLGSLSKQFVAAGVLVLAQDGKLALDDTVNRFIEEVPAAWGPITIGQLLSHTSGLPRDSEAFDPFARQPDMEIIRSLYDVPLVAAPGTRWAYSNIGYYVLAEIVSRLAGMPWTDFVRKRVFLPAGMTATTTSDPIELVPHRASGYTTGGGRIRNAEGWVAVRPSGGFASTVLDLAKWDVALDSDVVLDESSRARMWTPVSLKDGTRHPYGFGWFIDQVTGHRRIHHDGGLPGFSSDFERFPDDRLTVIVLANAGPSDLRGIALRVAAELVPALVAPSEPALTDDRPALSTRLKAILAGMAEGRVDDDAFSPKLASALRADLRSGFGDDLRSLGAAISIELLARERNAQGLTSRYRCVYRHVTLTVELVTDESGRIVRLGIDS